MMHKLKRYILPWVWLLLVFGAAVRGKAQTAGANTEIIVLEFVLDQVIVTGPSDPIRNSGQTQHSIFVRLENRPALTCTTTTLDVQIEQGVAFADDTSTFLWSDLGEAVTDAEYGAVGTTFRRNTAGAIQAIRVNAVAFDTTNCLLSVTYVGSVRPVALFDIGGNSFTNISVFLSNPTCPSSNAHFTFYNSTDGAYRICVNGVISDIGSGAGGGATSIPLLQSEWVYIDNTTGNLAPLNTRETATLTGVDAFWRTAIFSGLRFLQYTFDVPSNFASDPVLTFSGEGSSSLGTQDFDAILRCVADGENWDTTAWDADNTITVGFTGPGFLDTFTITLTNDGSMTAGDVCQLSLGYPDVGNEFDLIAARITYTGS
jgi:hypothetical protein